MIRNLAVTSDNFLIGGRETFLQANIRAIRIQEDVKTVLLADRIHASAALSDFVTCHEIGASQGDSLKHWLHEGREFLSRNQCEMIWAHHYCTLNSFLLAAYLNLPLHVTLHGSLANHGRYDRIEDVLGLTLALHRNVYVTAVSQEIVDELNAMLPEKKEIGVFHNKVILPSKEPARKMEGHTGNAVVDLVCLSRHEKTGHIRASIQVLSALLKVGVDARLSICNEGMLPEATFPLPRVAMFLAVSKLVGRKWICKNPGVLSAVIRTRLLPAVNDAVAEMQRADAVLGMGRVVLEAISAGRPAVLVGYDSPIDLLTPDNFFTYQYANFSGRGAVARPINEIASALAEELCAGHPDWSEAISAIDIIRGWPDTRAHHEKAASFGRVQLTNVERSIVEKYLMGSVTSTDMVARLISGLSDDERNTLEKLRTDSV